MAKVINRADGTVGFRGFSALWAASATSNLADGVLLVALPLTAISLRATPAAVAFVATAAGLPWVLSPIAGALADRFDRRKMAVLGNFGRTVVMGILAMLLATGVLTISLLTILALVLALLEVLVDSANETLLPGTVTDESIEEAIRRMRITTTMGNLFVGPGLAGLLFAQAALLPYVLCSAGYLICGAAESLLEGEFRPERTPSNIVRDLRDGIQWFAKYKLLVRLACMLSVIIGAQSMVTSQLVLYAVTPGPMGLSEAGYGFLQFAAGAGGLLAGLAAKPIIQRLGRAGVLRACALAAVIMFAIPGVTALLIPIVIGLFLGGAAEMLWIIIVRSVAQLITPMELLGRVGSIYTLLAWGSIPVGTVLGGVIASVLGVRAVFIIAAIATVVGLLVILLPISNRVIEKTREGGRRQNDDTHGSKSDDPMQAED